MTAPNGARLPIEGPVHASALRVAFEFRDSVFQVESQVPDAGLVVARVGGSIHAIGCYGAGATEVGLEGAGLQSAGTRFDRTGLKLLQQR